MSSKKLPCGPPFGTHEFQFDSNFFRSLVPWFQGLVPSLGTDLGTRPRNHASTSNRICDLLDLGTTLFFKEKFTLKFLLKKRLVPRSSKSQILLLVDVWFLGLVPRSVPRLGTTPRNHGFQEITSLPKGGTHFLIY